MAKPSKCYVVWVGRKPGLYHSWSAAEQQIKGYAGARYKSFTSEDLARRSLAAGRDLAAVPTGEQADYPKQEALCVDAAWNSVHKQMEYQGVWLVSGEHLFHQGPFAHGTNNIGEFLAVVHAMAWLRQRDDLTTAIYTDSRTAMAWVKKGKANSQSLALGVISLELQQLIARAERWLAEHPKRNPLLKWETKLWGEIPADFGRK